MGLGKAVLGMMQQDLKLWDDRRILSVSQIVHQVKLQLEANFRDIWVQGEVSNFRKPPSGHYYFSLKDNEAQIGAVSFRLQNRYLKFHPEDGAEVLARGSISVYPPQGKFQLVVEHLEPRGQGALQVAFEQLKTRLAAEGLFDPDRKKPLPLLPSRVGVVTSPSGAAIQDILKVLEGRDDRLDVLIFPVRVQGMGAAREISRGVRYLDSRPDVDVIIVGRGGGSMEDLWAFNEESVARAVASSETPVISAVGHEIDVTLTDFSADLRAPTPSAAAEQVCAVRGELSEAVRRLQGRAIQSTRLLLQHKRRQVERLASHRAFVDAETRVRYFLQRLDELRLRLVTTVPVQLPRFREKLGQYRGSLEQRMVAYLLSRRLLWKNLAPQLEAYSPQAVLQRGYSIVTNQSGQVVRDPQQVAAGESVQVRVAQGRFRARRENGHGG